jgi:hypothetical protein
LNSSGEFLDCIRRGGLIFFVSFFYQEKKESRDQLFRKSFTRENAHIHAKGSFDATCVIFRPGSLGLSRSASHSIPGSSLTPCPNPIVPMNYFQAAKPAHSILPSLFPYRKATYITATKESTKYQH